MSKITKRMKEVRKQVKRDLAKHLEMVLDDDYPDETDSFLMDYEFPADLTEEEIDRIVWSF